MVVIEASYSYVRYGLVIVIEIMFVIIRQRRGLWGLGSNPPSGENGCLTAVGLNMLFYIYILQNFGR